MITAPPHIFCGYDQHSQGYVCYDPQSRKFKVRATVQFDESWQCRALPTGAPIRVDDHPLNLDIDDDLPYLPPPTAAPTVFPVVPTPTPSPATVSPTIMPTTAPSVLPTTAPKPIRPKGAPSPSSPSVSKTDVPASFHRMSNGSPAVLRATGNESTRSPYINDRACRVHGHTFEQISGFRYEKNGEMVAYGPRDLQYNIKHGYVELAASVVVLKNFGKTVSQEQRALAKAGYNDAYTSACLVCTGSEPLS